MSVLYKKKRKPSGNGFLAALRGPNQSRNFKVGRAPESKTGKEAWIQARSNERGAIRRIVASSCSVSNGLSRNPSAPTALQALRVSIPVADVITRTFDSGKCVFKYSSIRNPTSGDSFSGGKCKSRIDTFGS